MRKIALPCYSLRWRLRLARKACAHSLSLLELAVAVKHVKWDLLLLLLLLLSVVPHVAAQTSTYTVSTKPAVCQPSRTATCSTTTPETMAKAQ